MAYRIGIHICTAPDELFEEKWDDVPKYLQDTVPAEGLGCEGDGKPGIWCQWSVGRSTCKWYENAGE